MAHHERKTACLALVAIVFLAGLGQAQAPLPTAPAQESAKPAAADEPDPTLTLKIGDPKLKDEVFEVGPGAILSGRT
ncbi:MAG: hypothetical protein HGA24_04205, partial [Candidatus Aminicenantes bacterium]|nr:hypothetical protein [Candidatus Aminicenantes bacterium]